MDLQVTVVSLDGVYDCRLNRKAIFNRGIDSQYQPEFTCQKTTQARPQAVLQEGYFDERFRTIERVFAWEDKFRRLLLRFERLSQVHYAFKSLAYTLINLRITARPNLRVYR